MYVCYGYKIVINIDLYLNFFSFLIVSNNTNLLAQSDYYIDSLLFQSKAKDDTNKLNTLILLLKMETMMFGRFITMKWESSSENFQNSTNIRIKLCAKIFGCVSK